MHDTWPASVRQERALDADGLVLHSLKLQERYVLPLACRPLATACCTSSATYEVYCQQAVILAKDACVSQCLFQELARASDFSLHDATAQVCLRVKFLAEVNGPQQFVWPPGCMSPAPASAADQIISFAEPAGSLHDGELCAVFDGHEHLHKTSTPSMTFLLCAQALARK